MNVVYCLRLELKQITLTTGSVLVNALQVDNLIV
jgi:hypothetical protein